MIWQMVYIMYAHGAPSWLEGLLSSLEEVRHAAEPSPDASSSVDAVALSSWVALRKNLSEVTTEFGPLIS